MTRYQRLARTGGQLSPLDRARLVVGGAIARAGWGRPPPRVVEDVIRVRAAIAVPAGAAGDAALAAVTAVSPTWLVGHVRRTFAWGAAFGVVRGLTFDREVLHVAALLHDLGLTDAHAPAAGECFAVHGAVVAHELARAQLAAPRAQAVAEAIALHLEPRVPVATGVEAHLLHAGAACDVLGASVRALPAAVVDEVLATWPRGDMNEALAARLAALAATSPRTRTGLYCRRFDFAARVRATQIGGAS